MNNLRDYKSTFFDSTNFFTKFIAFLIVAPILCLISPIKYLFIFLIFFLVAIFLSKQSFKFLKMVKIYILIAGSITIIIITSFGHGTFSERFTTSLIVALRIMSVISTGLFFSIIVTPKEIPQALINVGVPHKFGIVLMVAYRMIPITKKKIENIIIAQRCRGLSIRIFPISFSRITTFLISIFVPIVYSSLETSIRFSDTLLSRGYNPDGNITYKKLKFSLIDFLVLFLFLGLLVISLTTPF